MRPEKLCFAMIFVFCFVLFGCTPAKEELDLTQVSRIIEELENKFVQAALQGDATAAAALCTEDTFLMPPGDKMIQGKQKTEAYWREVWGQMKVTDFNLTRVSIFGSGDIVCELGNYTIKIEQEGLEPIEKDGKYLSVWKHMADGSWKRQLDMWNSNMPAQQ